MTKLGITKHEIKKDLLRVFKKAKLAGFEICVGSDPEGNGFNSINHNNMFYIDEKPDKIVLGVWAYRGDEELFG